MNRTRTQSKNQAKRKSDNYKDLARELRKLWKMKVTVIRIVISALRTILKNLERRLQDLVIRG